MDKEIGIMRRASANTENQRADASVPGLGNIIFVGYWLDGGPGCSELGQTS